MTVRKPRQSAAEIERQERLLRSFIAGRPDPDPDREQNQYPDATARPLLPPLLPTPPEGADAHLILSCRDAIAALDDLDAMGAAALREATDRAILRAIIPAVISRGLARDRATTIEGIVARATLVREAINRQWPYAVELRLGLALSLANDILAQERWAAPTAAGGDTMTAATRFRPDGEPAPTKAPTMPHKPPANSPPRGKPKPPGPSAA